MVCSHDEICLSTNIDGDALHLVRRVTETRPLTARGVGVQLVLETMSGTGSVPRMSAAL